MKLMIKTLAVGGMMLSVFAAQAEDWSKPNWLTDCSVNLKESYDNNVFLSGAAPHAYTLPAGSVAALKDAASWITTVSPKVGIDLMPLLGTTNGGAQFALTYAPDFVFYHDQNSESYDAQRLLTTLKAGNDEVTLNANNNFTYIDGDRYGPLYPGNCYSGFGTIFDRARRRQILETADFTGQLNFHRCFFRPTAALIYNDMMTEFRPQYSGYQNYADRTDVNGGADIGYKITDRFAATLGYRYGQQLQQQYSFSTTNAPNSYQRVLFGLEGKPWSWLEVKTMGGPDFRSYAGTTATHFAPVKNLNPVQYYGEAQIIATITKNDVLTFKYKYWDWLAGTGKVPYIDAAYELNYHHQFSEKLGLDFGGKFMSWDFDDNLTSVVTRHDLQYTCSGGLTYALNRHLNFNLGCAFNWGRNDENGVTNPAGREYDEQLFTLGATWKY